MTIYVMLREVCLKHRNNRREIILRVRTQVLSWQRCLFFWSYAARVSQPAPPICGHRPRAGCLNANQAMPVPFRRAALAQGPELVEGQFRLTAPFFRYPQSNHTTCAAGASLRSRVSKTPRARGSTETPCHFSNRGGARWEGSGLISRLRAGSIPAPATSFIGPLDHSGGHSPRKRESTVQSRGGPLFSNRGKVENPGSLISSPIVVRLHVPQPSRVGSRVKIACRL